MFPDPNNLAYAQAVTVPDLSGLPAWVQGVFYLVFVIGLALTVLIPRMGFLSGRDVQKATNNPAPGVPLVVAAVADPTAINNLATVLGSHKAGMDGLAAAVIGLKAEVQDLREELIRTNAKH